MTGSISRTTSAAHDARTRAVLLTMRYSVELSEVIERGAGLGTSGNNELRILTHLFTAGPGDRRALLALTGLSRSGVAQLLDRLEGFGLVTTGRGRDDQRTAVTALTSMGRLRVGLIEDMFSAYLSTPNPLVKELLDLLNPTSATPQPTTPGPTPPLAAVDRLAGFGARLSAQLDAEIGVAETRQRLALATLAAWGEARPKQLSDVLGLTSGGTTYLVDQLESAGIVERSYGTVPTDRRAVVIGLTPSGRAASERFADILFEHADEYSDILASAHWSN